MIPAAFACLLSQKEKGIAEATKSTTHWPRVGRFLIFVLYKQVRPVASSCEPGISSMLFKGTASELDRAS